MLHRQRAPLCSVLHYVVRHSVMIMVLYDAAVNVKAALTQSTGSVARTRYSLGCPTTGSTFNVGPVMRHDDAGSLVEYPVS